MDTPAYWTALNEADYLDVDCSVSDVKKFMNHTRHTLVPLLDVRQDLFGVVSALDIIEFLVCGGNPHATKAWEICSHKLVKCDAATSPPHLARLMLDCKLHHILLTQDDRVTAIVSSLDLCRYLLEQNTAG